MLLLPWALQGAEKMPVTRATTLAGKEFILPRDLRSSSILIIGFTQKSGAPMRDWRKALSSLCDSPTGTPCLQMPVLESVPRLFRSMVIRGIDKEVPSSLKDSFLATFEKEQDWKRAVEFNQPADAYVLLVNQKGEIASRMHGAPTREKLRELKEMTATVNR